MSGKRRAAGPAVKAAPGKKPSTKPAKGPSKNGSKDGGAPRTWKSRLLRVAKWLTVFGLVGALLVAGGLFYLYRVTDIPNPNSDFETQTTFVYYEDGKSEIGRFATQNRESIGLDQMPDTLKEAVIAAENKSFYTDSGIDPKGILRAAFSNARGNSQQGASTITQQYVKILYLSQERSYKRKLKEAILSLKIQRQQSKDEILQGYLNTIYFGRGAYGVQAASEAYFDKPAKKLNLRQSAVLASVLNNPTRFDPANGKAARSALKVRYAYVLDGMASAGDITAEQSTKAVKRLPKFPRIAAESTYGGQKGHVLKLVRSELLGLKDKNGDPLLTEDQIDGGGLRVTTTLTQKAMNAAKDGVLEVRPRKFPGAGQLHIGAASVEPGTGALRGFFGGQDYLDSQINWAATGGMAGSTMKAFTTATALEAGFSLKDTFDGNSPFTGLPGVSVRNEGSGYDGQGTDYGSAVNLTKALEESINTAFVDMSDSIPDGPRKIAEVANKLGVPPGKANKKYPGIPSRSTDFSPEDALITLGRARVSPINMANAYASIANAGRRADVHVIDKVVDKDGEQLYNFKASDKEAIPEDVAADTSYGLQQVVSNGTGRSTLALGRPAAGKTGTATNGQDQVSSAWFVGYTPQLATAVMYVRGDGDDQLDDNWLPSYNGAAGYFGSNYPARTWLSIMQADMEGLDVVDFPDAANLDGEAPTEGHAPTLPPKPTKKPSPTEKPTKSEKPTEKPTKTPKPTETPSPTETPTQTPSGTPTDCGLINPCPSDPTDSGTTSPGAGNSGNADQRSVALSRMAATPPKPWWDLSVW